ncbi:hypothetical protein GCM10028824_17730 [Hymenobacter segetis]|uniref:DUF4325 domain-containing protein n=1 Tax=Hymenobacter segetis TaxID=2025509 RepID=A0ABU9LX39_9BACT
MEIRDRINIAKDFSEYPGGRYKSEGAYSGEDFLLNHLMGKLIGALVGGYLLEIDLTGMNGYPSSFLSGSFGKITYELGKVIGAKKASDVIRNLIVLKCDDSVTRIQAVESEIANPVTKTEKRK